MNQIAIREPGTRSVLMDMSDRYGMEPAAFEATLRATVVPNNCTKEQFAAFLLVAKEYKLNPLLKEIYAFPSKGGIQPIVGVDGWANLINSHPAFDGMDFEDHFDGKGDLVSITCKMHRKDRSHPITATEYLSECKRATEPWQKWPRRMLRHKAMIQAARYAFSFAGIIDPDEAERFAGDLARDITPRGQIVPISQRIAASTEGGASTQTTIREQFSNTQVAETSTTQVDAAQVDQAGVMPATKSNSSPAPSPVETDKPATEASPLPPVAGDPIQSSDGDANNDAALKASDVRTTIDDASLSINAPSDSTLAVDWQQTYLTAMQRATDRPKSLLNRHTEAIQIIGGKANASEQEWMRAVFDLRKRNLEGALSKTEYDAAIREMVDG